MKGKHNTNKTRIADPAGKREKVLHQKSLKISTDKSFDLLVKIGVYTPNGQLTPQYGG